MLSEVMGIAVAFDLPADPGPVSRALSGGAALLAEAGVPAPSLADWPAAITFLDEFLSGSRWIGDSEVSVRIARAAEAVAEADPLAALLPAAVVVAEWEGGSADWLFSTRRGAVNWGWHGLVLPLARIMAAIPALWSARQLVEDASRGMWLVRARDPGDLDWHVAEALAGFRDLRDQIETKYLAARDRLARDIQRATRPATAAIRAPLAALWWTLGDPWHAHGVADTSLAPTLNQVRRLVDRILRRTSIDPLLAGVGDRLWRGPSLDVTRHESVRRRMGTYLPPSASFIEFEALTKTLGVSPSNAYSRALTSFFSGTSSHPERATISELLPHVERFGGIATIRFTALHLLLESIDGRSTQQRWHELAQRAATVATRLNYGAPYSYDRSLDLPLYYLDGDPDYLYRTVEHHRAASMDLVLRNLRPLIDVTPDTAALLDDEKQMLTEIRWFRHGRRLPRLAGRGDDGSQSVHSLEIPEADFDAEHDPRLALADRLRRLNAIRSELAPLAPGYVAAEAFQADQAADLARAFGAGPPDLPASSPEVPATPPDRPAMPAEQTQAGPGDDARPAGRVAMAEALMAEAARQKNAHEYQDALATQETVLLLFGADPDPAVRAIAAEAMLGKGLDLGELEQPVAEMQAYDEATARFGSDTDPAVRVWASRALFNKGVVLRQLGQLDAALPVYDDIVARFGQDPDPGVRQVAAKALVRQGDVLRELGRPADAVAAYNEVAARFADSVDPAIVELVRTARDNRHRTQAGE